MANITDLKYAPIFQLGKFWVVFATVHILVAVQLLCYRTAGEI